MKKPAARKAGMTVEVVKLSDLHSDPTNARAHPERNLRAICASLARFGQQKPVVVDENNVVRAGNGTMEAAKRLGWESISVVRTTLEAVEATAFSIADNKTGELAEWDFDVLKALVSDLPEDLRAATGFDPGELIALVDGVWAVDPVVETPKAHGVSFDERQWVIVTGAIAAMGKEAAQLKKAEALTRLCAMWAESMLENKSG